MARKIAEPTAAARIAILVVFDRLLFAVRGNCCCAGATLPAFASATNFSMSFFSFASALLVPFSEVALTSREVAGSPVFAPSANAETEQTHITNTKATGNVKSFLIIDSPGRFYSVPIKFETRCAHKNRQNIFPTG